METKTEQPKRKPWPIALLRFLRRPAAMLAYLVVVGLLVIRLWDDVITYLVFAVIMTIGLVVDRRVEGPGYFGAGVGGCLGAMFADARYSFSILDVVHQWSSAWSLFTAAVGGVIVSQPYAWIWRRLDPHWGHVVARKAQRKLERGHADSALAQYTYAIETNPGEAIPYNNRGLAYMRLGKFAEALQDFTEALQVNPRLTAAYCNRASCFAHLGDADRALADFTSALECEPHNAAVHHQLGALLSRMGDLHAAHDALTQAVTLDPSLAAAYFERASVLAAMKKQPAAIEDLNRAVWVAPDFAAAFHLRGQIHAERRNFTSAIQDFSAAIRLEPNQPVYYRSRAAAYEATSYFAESRADLDRAGQLTAR